MNRYPLWKYLILIAVIAVGVVYSLPNLYAPDPAIQISGESSGMVMDAQVMEQAIAALEEEGVGVIATEGSTSTLLIRLDDRENQMRAKRVVEQRLGSAYIVALNMAPTTPRWLTSIGAYPMSLGLDLSGGVHFLLEVDIDSAIQNRLEAIATQIRNDLREERVRYVSLRHTDDNTIEGIFPDEQTRRQTIDRVRADYRELLWETRQQDGRYLVTFNLGDSTVREIEGYAISQNLSTLRNRVNELGVSEPVVQRQGRNRIIVQLPGVQDTAEAKRIIGRTANLEFRLEAGPDETFNREEFEFLNPEGREPTAYLERTVIITGDQVANAQSSFDENGMPQVNITLNAEGGARMHRVTRHNVGRRLGVLFIEYKTRVTYDEDEEGNVVPVQEQYVDRDIISLATIQSALGVQFRVTGLSSPREASELALLLRAGALAAPMYFVEERTIGPSLGAENIAMGVTSVQIGLALVAIFMLVVYKLFGLFANLALLVNLVLVVAAMSLFGATLTLPGIAGVVLTVGMAVDANVLIFSRIREELANGLSVQAAISAGYDRAFVSILDANITTLIVALILFAIGTGPVQGFAVTLSIGILASMFTAIFGTRALVNLVYGGRNVQKLLI